MKKQADVLKTYKQYVRTGAIVLSLMVVPFAASAAVHRLDSLEIDIPDTWDVKTRFMGLDLFARPSAEQDRQAWARDQITLSKQARGKSAKTLEHVSKEKLAQISHHATAFSVLSQRVIDVADRKALQTEIRYTEGMRDLQGWCVVMLDGEKNYVTVMLLSDPAAFAQLKKPYEAVLKSVRFVGTASTR